MKVVPVLAVALVLCACNSGATTPTGSPSPTTTSASPSPSLTRSTIASELEAAARAYYAEASRAIATGDVTRLRAMAVPTCACQQLVRYIEQKWASGSIKGGQFVIERVGPAVIEPKVLVVPVVRGVTPYEILDSSGRVVERGPADLPIREDVYLKRQGASYIVENVVVPK